MWRNYDILNIWLKLNTWLFSLWRFFLSTKWEFNIKFLMIICSCKRITSIDHKFAIIDYQWLSILNVLWSNKIFSISLTWLIERKLPWEFLSSQHHSKWISTTIWRIYFLDFNCVISQIIVKYVWNLWENKKFKNLFQYKIMNTFLSFSKNYFYDVTLPPPNLCSK